MPTQKEIERIIQLWNEGCSYGEITKEVNPGKKSTVQGWIEGLIKKGEITPRTDNVRTNTKNATAAKKNYDRVARQDLNNKLFCKVEEMALEAKSTSDLKNLIISFGILTDKREIIEPYVPPTIDDDGLLDALDAQAADVFDDISVDQDANSALQVDSTEQKAVANPDLVDEGKPYP